MRIGRFIICISVGLAAVGSLASCSTTRRIPDGSHMLKRNVIHVDRDAPRKERITASELNRYVQQSPNRHFLGTNLYAWLYAQADPEKNNGGNRFLRRIGEEPVVWDPERTAMSAEYLKTYTNSRGFFSGTSEYRVDTLRNKKVRVRYSVRQGPPSFIGNVRYMFLDSLLREVVLADSTATLLREGEIFDINVIDRERTRIVTNLKNKGYYDFDVGSINFLADSTNRSHLVDVTMVVRQHLDGYEVNGTPVYSPHKVYRMGQIFVRPDFDPLEEAGEADSLHARLDTISTRGINIVYAGKQNVRSRVLRHAIRLAQDGLYSAAEANATSAELMRLGAFRSVSVVFNPVEGGGTGSVGNPPEGILNCDIRCVPGLKHSFSVQLEGTTASTFYGLRTTVGYQNRNIFRGAELFDASVTAGFEFLKASTRKLAYEVGGSVSLSFPRIVLSDQIGRRRRIRAPLSKLTLSGNWQDRVYYSRALFGLNWGYSWGIRRFENLTVRPFDISVVKMRSIDETFRQQLANPYLVASYSDQIIAGISASYVFNNQPRDLNAGAVVLRLNVETTGNLLSGVARLLGKPQPDGHYNILGTRFAQYVRGEISFSQKIVLGEKTALVYRLYGGAILPYGNSTSPPFDKLFYAGGASSMRGWAVRTLGPGSQQVQRQNWPAQMGDVKLEANLELRFPIFKALHGATFVDVGNIWFMRSKPDQYPETAVFRINNFYKQLGFNTGIGLRVDIKFVVLRLDWGIQLHSPNFSPGQRWIRRFRLRNSALGFGVGYPF